MHKTDGPLGVIMRSEKFVTASVKLTVHMDTQ